jgi:hypothetical protein
VVHPLAERHGLEQLRCLPFRFMMRDPGRAQRRSNVLHRAQARDQVERLEADPDGVAFSVRVASDRKLELSPDISTVIANTSAAPNTAIAKRRLLHWRSRKLMSHMRPSSAGYGAC